MRQKTWIREAGLYSGVAYYKITVTAFDEDRSVQLTKNCKYEEIKKTEAFLIETTNQMLEDLR